MAMAYCKELQLHLTGTKEDETVSYGRLSLLRRKNENHYELLSENVWIAEVRCGEWGT
jgi:hypothetical protein